MEWIKQHQDEKKASKEEHRRHYKWRRGEFRDDGEEAHAHNNSRGIFTCSICKVRLVSWFSRECNCYFDRGVGDVDDIWIPFRNRR